MDLETKDPEKNNCPVIVNKQFQFTHVIVYILFALLVWLLFLFLLGLFQGYKRLTLSSNPKSYFKAKKVDRFNAFSIN